MIIVTGANGFIGRNLEFFLPLEERDIFRLKVDIRNYVSMVNQMKHWFKDSHPWCIIHLAALTDAFESVEVPLNYFETNLLGTINLLEAMRMYDIEKIVFASSAAVEEVQNPYGLTKKNAEEWIKLYSELYGIKYVILRIYNVYGPGNNKGVVYNFMKNVKEGKPIVIYGGKQIRDFVYVDDVCKIIVKSLYLEDGTYYVGTGKGTSINKLANLIMKVANKKVKIIRKPAKENEIKVSICPRQDFNNYLPLEKGLKKYWEVFP